MKNLYVATFALLLAVIFSTPALAKGSVANKVFGLYSGAAAAVTTSDAVDVRGYKTKSLSVSGVSLISNPTSVAYQNMSGTTIVQVAPSSAGPWSTAIANDYAQTAVSRTTNGIFTWSDSFPYVRIKWTAGTVGTKLKAWVDLLE
jgi:hypothetical protein